MINLLFISNNPQVELLRNHFQQILKLRIEVVEDFDHGLKDVFEKRPAVVCIQDQIAGVTGESVARHIQLLLGNGSPRFVLMHEGSAKAQAVPGLFNNLIDLSNPFDATCETLRKTLQSLLGERWDLLYCKPLEEAPSSGHVAGDIASADHPLTAIVEPPALILQSPDLQSMLEPEGVVVGETFVEQTIPTGIAPKSQPIQPALVSQEPAVSAVPFAFAEPSPDSSRLASLHEREHAPEPQRPKGLIQQVSSSPSEGAEELDTSPVSLDELLHNFEENYRSRKRMLWRFGVAVLVVLVAGVLLFFAMNRSVPQALSPVAVEQKKTVGLQQSPVQAVVSSVTAAASKEQVVAQQEQHLPTFILKTNRDTDFSATKPGWFRYLSDLRDYRLFYADGRLQALQVLGRGDNVINDAELKRVLHELTGTDQYRIERRENKNGLHQEHALILPGRSELLIYRASLKGPIKAFVVAPKL